MAQVTILAIVEEALRKNPLVHSAVASEIVSFARHIDSLTPDADERNVSASVLVVNRLRFLINAVAKYTTIKPNNDIFHEQEEIFTICQNRTLVKKPGPTSRPFTESELAKLRAHTLKLLEGIIVQSAVTAA